MLDERASAGGSVLRSSGTEPTGTVVAGRSPKA